MTSPRLTVGALGLLALASPSIAQCELQKVRADNSACGKGFGQALAVSGDTLLVGSPTSSATAFASGAAYVFERGSSGSWAQAIELAASDTVEGLNLGTSVAIDGDFLAVGAQGANSSRGAIYVFQRSAGNSWAEVARLVANDGSPGDFLGADGSLSMDGGVIVVGVCDAEDVWLFEGLVYVFELINGAWTQTAKLRANDAEYGLCLGSSVAVSGDTIVAGASGFNGATQDEGAAYVFEKVGGAWVQVAKLTASDPEYDDRFGHAVSIEGDLLAVSAPLEDSVAPGAGAVYVFERNAQGMWDATETWKIVANDGQQVDTFGLGGISLSGNLLLAPALGDDDLAISNSGAAYLFERSTSGWSQVAKLTASDAALSDTFGFTAALDGELAVIAATGDDDADPSNNACGSGAVYVFQLPHEISTYGFGSGCPCGNDDPARGCDNSTGLGATLGAKGSTSVSSDDLILCVAHLPTFKTGIFYMGGGQTNLAFGDGLRCVTAGSAGLYRFLPPVGSGSTGRMSLGPGIAARSQTLSVGGAILPGDTWNFQCWYRDPLGPCGSAFNLSNGLAVTFSP